MYIASSYYNGLHISNIRYFDNETDAVLYVKSLPDCNCPNFIPSFARVYEIFDNKPPRLVKL